MANIKDRRSTSEASNPKTELPNEIYIINFNQTNEITIEVGQQGQKGVEVPEELQSRIIVVYNGGTNLLDKDKDKGKDNENEKA